MNVALKRADAHAGARETACAGLLERRLKRYQPRFQARVRSLAERHPRLKDLAASFPALLFALAVPRVGCDPTRVSARVIDGAPLRELAAMASLPLWLRRLEPAAFGAPIPQLPDGPFVSRQIVNHIPRGTKNMQAWLDAISRAYTVADVSVAVWMAREWANVPKRSRSGCVPWLLLWSWYARHVPNDACKIKQAWKPSLSFVRADRLASEWRSNVLFFVEIGDDAVADIWLEPASVGGFDFVPLHTYADIASEAIEMKNCVRTFGSYIGENMSRLWSMRRGGERVATVEVQFAQESPYPHIAQVKLADDGRAPEGVWRVAQAWLAAQPQFRPGVRFACWGTTPANVRAWRRMWRPYWLAKRRFPDWLPLTPDRDTVDCL
jgi:hypothetical protein